MCYRASPIGSIVGFQADSGTSVHEAVGRVVILLLALPVEDVLIFERLRKLLGVICSERIIALGPIQVCCCLKLASGEAIGLMVVLQSTIMLGLWMLQFCRLAIRVHAYASTRGSRGVYASDLVPGRFILVRKQSPAFHVS